MANTYTLLETVTVGAAGAASVTFNSIPQTGYTDLVIKCSVRGTASALYASLAVRFNGDSAANYKNLAIQGDGASAISYAQTSQTSFNIGNATGATATANTFDSSDVYIPNYTSSNYKSISVDDVMENNAATAYNTLTTSLWSQTAAITTINIFPGSGSFSQHSTFSLYGVSALGTTPTKAPKATGGSIIQTDGTYWYHAFLSSGTFTPALTLSCDVLVVAGGGGGGFSYGAGAGAGGIFHATAQSIAATGQTVTIGAGGISGSARSAQFPGENGSNSTFASLTAAVGGGGGGSNGAVQTFGSAGGSGGGGTIPSAAAGATNQTSTGGTGYGFAGGAGNAATASGGGGGAGSVGLAPTGNVGGAGGAGTSAFSSWGSVTGTGTNVSGTYYFAGGGSGSGSGGEAAPGNGGTVARTSGAANTGAGGGGDSSGTTYGGSGIVIVRYLAA